MRIVPIVPRGNKFLKDLKRKNKTGEVNSFHSSGCAVLIWGVIQKHSWKELARRAEIDCLSRSTTGKISKNQQD